jgi:sugar phosphate isomerase/epimerase
MRMVGLAPVTVFVAPEDRTLKHIELIDAAADAGADAVGLFVNVSSTAQPTLITTDRQERTRAKEHARARGLQIPLVESFRLVADTDVEKFRAAIEAGAELGATQAMCAADDKDRSRLGETLGRFSEICAEYGLRVALEFVPFSGASDLTDAVGLAETAGPRVGVVLDVLHWSRTRSGLDSVRRFGPTKISLVHLSDATKDLPADDDGIRAEWIDRLYPGEGGLPLIELLQEVPESIPVFVEAPKAIHSRLTPSERARGAIEATRRVIAQLETTQRVSS